MGVVRQAALRGVLHAIAIALSLATGIVIARRLTPLHYAAYQMVVKRTALFSSALCTIMGFWAYRYAAMGVRGAVRDYLKIVVLNAVLAMFVALGLGIYMGLSNASLLSLACIAGGLTVAFGGLNRVIVAVRAVYSELVVAIRRLVYALLVIALIYLATLEVWGAFIAVIASLCLGIALQIRGVWRLVQERPERSLVREWARSIHIPVLMWVAGFVASMDALLVAYLGGGYAAAEFFVSVALLSMVMEVINVASMHIAAYTLRTMDIAGGVRVSRIAILIAALVCGYAAARPAPLIALMNPLYISASTALSVYAIGAVLRMGMTPIWSSLVGSVRDLATSPSRRLVAISVANAVTSAIYIALIPLIAALSRLGVVVSWAVAYLVYGVASVIAAYIVGDELLRGMIVRKVVPRMVLFTAIAFSVAYTLTPSGFSRSFFSDALTVIEGLSISSAIYTPIVLAIDREMRHLVKEFVERVRRAPLAWV